MYQRLTSVTDHHQISIGIASEVYDRTRNYIPNKKISGKYLYKTSLKDIFSFAEHQEVSTSG